MWQDSRCDPKGIPGWEAVDALAGYLGSFNWTITALSNSEITEILRLHCLDLIDKSPNKHSLKIYSLQYENLTYSNWGLIPWPSHFSSFFLLFPPPPLCSLSFPPPSSTFCPILSLASLWLVSELQSDSGVLSTKNRSFSAGFEPARGDPNGFLVHRLNHSATTTDGAKKLHQLSASCSVWKSQMGW